MTKIFEAESDYVKIGNTVLPRNMIGNEYDGMSYDTIAKQTKSRYDDEKQAEADAKARAELQAKAQPKLDEVNKAIESGEEPIVALFDAFVPSSGKADTVGGELVRAMNKVGYRYYNDGDWFFCGYGLETCGSCATYVSETIDFWDEFYRIAENSKSSYDVDDIVYEDELKITIEKFCNYMFDHTELFATPNNEDCLKAGVDEWERLYDSFEWDVQLPENVRFHLDRGDISEYDIEDQIRWDFNISNNADIYVDSSGYVQFEDLTWDELQQMEGHTYNALESWGEDLDDEYGSEEDEYDDDYDDEDEDE